MSILIIKWKIKIKTFSERVAIRLEARVITTALVATFLCCPTTFFIFCLQCNQAPTLIMLLSIKMKMRYAMQVILIMKCKRRELEGILLLGLIKSSLLAQYAACSSFWETHLIFGQNALTIKSWLLLSKFLGLLQHSFSYSTLCWCNSIGLSTWAKSAQAITSMVANGTKRLLT